MSDVTDAQLRSPRPSSQEINARIDIGQHPTPEMVSFIPNYEAYEEGYDSDGQVGPFLDAVVGEEMFAYFETAVPTIGFVFLNSFPPCRGL